MKKQYAKNVLAYATSISYVKATCYSLSKSKLRKINKLMKYYFLAGGIQ